MMNALFSLAPHCLEEVYEVVLACVSKAPTCLGVKINDYLKT